MTFEQLSRRVLGLPILAAGFVGITFSVFLLYGLVIGIYNVYFHPLRRFPGPKLWIASHLRRHWANINGLMDLEIQRFHETYGEVVRYSPDELSFSSAQAWKDIYGYQGRLPKDPLFYRNPTEVKEEVMMFFANDEDHARMRKRVSHAFSELALREQEPRIQYHISTLIHRLREHAATDTPVDMVGWYNFTTFDIVGDLAFGLDDGFGCLRNSEFHRWVGNVYQGLKGAPYVNMMNHYRIFWDIFQLFEPKNLLEARLYHERFSRKAVTDRLDKGIMLERKDFWSHMLSPKTEKDSMTRSEMIAQGNPLVIAGSETTATSLCGLTYLLLSNPSTLRKVTDEIRAAFAHEADITFARAATELPYTLAAINEGLRCYPPVPTILPRLTKDGQITIVDGHELPPNTHVGVHPLATYRSPRNFHNPCAFVPERWLCQSPTSPDPKSSYYGDTLEACQPFGLGPRACLGKNLAYSEMRMILARVLWNFDLELCSESTGWDQQRSFVLWDKPAMMVRLTDVRGRNR